MEAKEAERTINRLNIARGDVDRCVKFLEAANHHAPRSIEYEALVACAIINYAKPFSQNERPGSSKALPSVPQSVIRDYSVQELELHDRIINRRNKAIAHSEWNEFQTSVDCDTKMIDRQRYFIYPEFLDIKPFTSLAKKLLDQLHNVVADLVLGKS